MYGEITSQQSKPRVERSSSFRGTLFALLAPDLLGLSRAERKPMVMKESLQSIRSGRAGEGGVH